MSPLPGMIFRAQESQAMTDTIRKDFEAALVAEYGEQGARNIRPDFKTGMFSGYQLARSTPSTSAEPAVAQCIKLLNAVSPDGCSDIDGKNWYDLRDQCIAELAVSQREPAIPLADALAADLRALGQKCHRCSGARKVRAHLYSDEMAPCPDCAPDPQTAKGEGLEVERHFVSLENLAAGLRGEDDDDRESSDLLIRTVTELRSAWDRQQRAQPTPPEGFKRIGTITHDMTSGETTFERAQPTGAAEGFKRIGTFTHDLTTGETTFERAEPQQAQDEQEWKRQHTDNHFRVEVSDHDGQIVAIEPGMLAGRNITEYEENKISRAIAHLCGFIGSELAPADQSGSAQAVDDAALQASLRNLRDSLEGRLSYEEDATLYNAIMRLGSRTLPAVDQADGRVSVSRELLRHALPAMMAEANRREPGNPWHAYCSEIASALSPNQALPTQAMKET